MAIRNTTQALIEKWFAAHGDDGEFLDSPSAAAYLVIGPSENDGRVVFTTKPSSIEPAIYGWAP